MENLIIKTKSDTPFIPNVNFDSATGKCVLEGESFMDNSFEFYTPLLEWLKTYCSVMKSSISFIVKLTYFNTSTSRLLLEILELLANYSDRGGDVDIIWYCFDDDPDMRDEIDDFEEETGLNIQVEEIPRP